MAKKTKTRRVKNVLKKRGSKKHGKTVKKVKKGTKRGGMPARYFGMPGESNFTSNAKMTTSCLLPKNTTWACLGPVPSCK